MKRRGREVDGNKERAQQGPESSRAFSQCRSATLQSNETGSCDPPLNHMQAEPHLTDRRGESEGERGEGARSVWKQFIHHC